MAVTAVRFRRRVTGAPGAPAALKTAEPSYNMVDGRLYVGFGDDASGNATSVKVFAKDDFLYNIPAVVAGKILGVTAGAPAWIDPPSGGTNYTAGNGITITAGEIAADGSVVALRASPIFTGTPAAPTAAPGTNTTQLSTTAFVAAAIAGFAPLASPVFTGAPIAPTAADGTNNTQIATTAFVTSKINAILGGADAAHDTFIELQNLMAADESTAAALAITVGGKLQKDQNLSDLTNVGTARGNLGLGTIATQNANAVNITGGTIAGVDIDGGTF